MCVILNRIVCVILNRIMCVILNRIVCVSSPTAYKRIRELKGAEVQAFCLEFDDRFRVFGEDYVFYDYNEPLRLPVEFKNSFDFVLADPPFLSEECLCKMAVTIRYLMKDKVLLCTGEVHQQNCIAFIKTVNDHLHRRPPIC